MAFTSALEGLNQIVLKASVDTTQAVKDLQSFSDRLNNEAQNISKFTGALSQTWETLTAGARAWSSLAAAGDQYGDVMSQLKTDISLATEALHGQVAELDLAMAANSAMKMGLNLTAEQFADLAKVAKSYADATGGDAAAATQQLAMAMATGRERALRPFGIEAGTISERLEQLSKKAGQANVEIGGVTDATDALTARWTTLSQKVGESIDENGPLTKAISGLASMVGWASQSATAVEALGTAFTMFTAGPLVDLIDKLDDLPNWFWTSGPQALGAQIEGVALPGEDMAGRAILPGASFQPRERRRPQQRRRGGGGGGGGGARQTPEQGPFRGSLTLEQFDAEQEAREEEEQSREEWARRTEEYQAALHQIDLDAADQRRDLHDEEMDRMEREADARERFAEQEATLAERRRQAHWEAARGILSASSMLIGGLAGDKQASMILTGLEEEVAVAASIAAQDYIGAAAHEVAAILAFANAAEAGSMGGGKGRGHASASKSGFLPSRPADSGGGGGGNVTNITNVMVDTAGTGFVPEDASYRFYQMSELTQRRHGFRQSPREQR